MSLFRCSVTVVVAAVLCAGCAHKRKPSVRKPPKPWIGTRSLCIFPMAQSPVPGEPDSLAQALTAGWRARMNVPVDAEIVHIEDGDDDRALDSMLIDLSNAIIDYDRKQKKLRPTRHVHGSVRVDSLEFVARPLMLERSKMHIDMSVSDARLDMRRDRRGRPMLTLADARDGRITLEVPKKDIDALLLYASRKMAGKYGVSIDRTKLKIKVVDDRSIRMDLKIDTRLGILPAGLRFKARIDIDDQLNGKIARLACEGDQLLGPLISAIVNPVLQKYEGRKRPLVGFAWGDMKLYDVTLRSDETFRIEAKFGRVDPQPTQVVRRVKKRAA
jgi:hypothetical protein